MPQSVIRVRVKPYVTPAEMLEVLALYGMQPVKVEDAERILWLRGPLERVGQILREVRGIEETVS